MNEVVSADDGRKYKTQVARPGARPGDPSEANGDPKRDARAAKDAQQMCKRVPRSPREANGHPKRDTRAAKDAQEGLKTDPSVPREANVRPKRDTRAAKDAQDGLQRDPSGPKGRPLVHPWVHLGENVF